MEKKKWYEQNECVHFDDKDVKCKRAGMFHYFMLVCPFYGSDAKEGQKDCAGFDSFL